MRNVHPVLRAVGALIPPVVMLALGVVVSNPTVASLFNVAALIYLAVFVFEAMLERRRSPSRARAAAVVVDRSYMAIPNPLLKVISFIGTSTPVVTSESQTGNASVLDAWLDLVSVRLSKAVGKSAGAMVVREEFFVDDIELVPFCEVAYVGGSQQCTLPTRSRIPIKGGIAWDVAQCVGARSIFLTRLVADERRYWLCVTFVADVKSELLQPICNAMAAPVSAVLSNLDRVSYRAGGPSRGDLQLINDPDPSREHH